MSGEKEKGHTVEDFLQGSIGNHISSFFKLVTIAEEEIADAVARNPTNQVMYGLAFIALRPTRVLQNLERLYRAHVRELLQRVDQYCESGKLSSVHLTKNLRAATRAEKLGVLMVTSLRAPLQHDYAQVYDQLFIECFGEEEWQTIQRRDERAGELEPVPPRSVQMDNEWARGEIELELERTVSRACGDRFDGNTLSLPK